MSLNVGESIAWQTVAAFLRGDLDHEDSATREAIGKACADLDLAAYKQLKAGRPENLEQWFDHLAFVTTEAR